MFFFYSRVCCEMFIIMEIVGVENFFKVFIENEYDRIGVVVGVDKCYSYGFFISFI